MESTNYMIEVRTATFNIDFVKMEHAGSLSLVAIVVDPVESDLQPAT